MNTADLTALITAVTALVGAVGTLLRQFKHEAKVRELVAPKNPPARP